MAGGAPAASPEPIAAPPLLQAGVADPGGAGPVGRLAVVRWGVSPHPLSLLGFHCYVFCFPGAS